MFQLSLFSWFLVFLPYKVKGETAHERARKWHDDDTTYMKCLAVVPNGEVTIATHTESVIADWAKARIFYRLPGCAFYHFGCSLAQINFPQNLLYWKIQFHIPPQRSYCERKINHHINKIHEK